MTSRRIVVSVDFGTTYSGIAWAETTHVCPHFLSSQTSPLTHQLSVVQPEFQTVIDTWPARGGGTTNSPKVPTELRRVATGYQWGFQIPPAGKRNKYFKL